MQVSKMLGVAMGAAVALVAIGASAEDEHFQVSTKANLLTVTTSGGWHINKDFPWKLTCGSNVADKSKFDLKESTATVTGGSGECELKGAVCSAGSCAPFKKAVKF